MGGQVAVAGYFLNYLTETRRNMSATAGANFHAVAQGWFTIGRFLETFSMRVKPRFVLFVFTSVTLSQAVATGPRGDAGLAPLILVFFESTFFPTVFTPGIRGAWEAYIVRIDAYNEWRLWRSDSPTNVGRCGG